ncbi:MAG: peptidoglycan D,D-transpeptidase FtsI family protein [Candidatus Geothermincolia bacterium]
MNKQIKVLLAVFVILMLTIVVNLSWIQIFGADNITANGANKRRLVEQYAIQRGDILSADNQVVARSVDTGTEYKYQRQYPLGSLFADVTGYDSWKYGRTGLEKTYNNDLLGSGSHLTFRSLGNRLLGDSKKGNSILMTTDSRVQEVAAEALSDVKGAVVAMDPKTGKVLAMVTSPTYNPNAAVPASGKDNQAQWDAYNADPNRPLFNRATSGLYPPGSSFKVVTGAAALDQGVVTPDTPFDCTGKLLVHGYTIYDFNKKSHGSLTFAEALVVSCNITFAQVGLKLGAPALVQYSEMFGFNKVTPFDLPTAVSHIQDAKTMDPVALASASFGQGQDLATPLEMAMVASTVANGGVLMKPYLVDEVKDYNNKIIQQFGPKAMRRVVDQKTAQTLTEIMIRVVSDGTGTAAQIDGVDVAGKTGTAEVENGEPHAWFICFAPAHDPKVAVAVVVENGGEGGRTAAPIARDVLEEALRVSQ